MILPLLRLAVALQAVAQVAEILGHLFVADWMLAIDQFPS